MRESGQVNRKEWGRWVTINQWVIEDVSAGDSGNGWVRPVLIRVTRKVIAIRLIRINTESAVGDKSLLTMRVIFFIMMMQKYPLIN